MKRRGTDMSEVLLDSPVASVLEETPQTLSYRRFDTLPRHSHLAPGEVTYFSEQVTSFI